ncbi:putative membrane protein YfcA [Cupriavidus necator]|nr:putative membrane protein YfcA [Cupriavidus necator]
MPLDSTLLIVIAGAAVAGFVQGLSGFAFGMVAMSFWAWAIEPRLAAAMTVFGALTGQLLAAASVRRGLSWRRRGRSWQAAWRAFRWAWRFCQCSMRSGSRPCSAAS